jgi:preprotein translocase subunit SecY
MAIWLGKLYLGQRDKPQIGGGRCSAMIIGIDGIAGKAYAITHWLEGSRGSTGAVVIEPAPFFRISTVVTMVSGTIFLMWLGEQITARGVGNGPPLIISAGIVAEMPIALYRILEQSRSD